MIREVRRRLVVGHLKLRRRLDEAGPPPPDGKMRVWQDKENAERRIERLEKECAEAKALKICSERAAA